jgi:4-amino-4-deoxy-L-arabinose transferase-like glycosyltransferase
MFTKHESNYLTAAWLLIIAGAIFRTVYAGAFLLAPDETNYWQWSRHLAWGYHDQAPMIAWAIRFCTWLFGHTEISVRLPSLLAVTITSAYAVAIAKRWVGPVAAFNTALLSQVILEFNVGGLMATPDGLQACAWAGAAYHVARAYEDDRLTQWLWGGFWFGFGMLSKYTMVLFLPGAYLYGMLSASHRPRLTKLRPYIGVGLGSLMFLPVIYWNFQNDWNSVRHVAYLGGANEAFTLHFKYIGDLFAAQAALLSPLVFILVLMAWAAVLWKNVPQRHWIYSYLLFTSLPTIAFFCVLSLHTRIYGNWPGSAYVTAIVLVAAFYGRKKKSIFKMDKPTWGQRIWPWAIISAAGITGLILLQAVWPVFPVPTELDRTSTEIQGWDKLGQEVGRVRQQMPDPAKTFLFGMRYQIASELAFYTPGQPDTVSINRWDRPNVYDYWNKDSDFIGFDAVGVTTNPNRYTSLLKQVFTKVDPPIKLDIYRKRPFANINSAGKPVKTYYLYRAYGFKGGLRWQPPDKADIRAG